VVTGHPHNEYLEITAEYGLIGFGLFALAWGYGLIRLLIFALKTQNQHHAFMAMAFLGTAMGTMIHSFFDFEMHVFQNALIFALLAAIATGPICGRRQEVLLKEEEPGFQGVWLRGIRIALALVAVVGMLLALQTFSSTFFRAEADRLVESREPELAKRYYQRAIRIDPANWRAYRGMGSVCFKERYYSLDRKEKRELAQIERDFFAKGYAHNPKDATLVSAYGMVTIFLGDTDAGIDLLRQAAALRPFNDNHWWNLGVELRKAGHYEEALEVFKKAKTLKNTPSIRANIQWLERQMKPSTPVVQKKQSVESTLLKRPEKIIPIEDLYKLMENP
jgi:tetratricopeptide (TPR) repeat protein